TDLFSILKKKAPYQHYISFSDVTSFIATKWSPYQMFAHHYVKKTCNQICYDQDCNCILGIYMFQFTLTERYRDCHIATGEEKRKINATVFLHDEIMSESSRGTE
ncbi:hypothetical protein ACJX0J_007491, partial [Zea mays]